MDVYATRKMQKDFIEKYSKALRKKNQNAILCQMYQELILDRSAAETMDQEMVDERVVDFILHCDDLPQ